MRRALGLLLLAACGTRAPSHRQASVAEGHPTEPADTTPPRAAAGWLVTRTVAEQGALAGRWQPRAGVCVNPPSFQLLAQGDSVDALVVLALLPDTTATGTYAVSAATDTMRQARTARIGVQQMRSADFAYQATGGSVWLRRLDRLATGGFDVTLQEMPSHRTLRYRGVFDAIPVDTLDAAACRPAAPDSARPAIGRKPA